MSVFRLSRLTAAVLACVWAVAQPAMAADSQAPLIPIPADQQAAIGVRLVTVTPASDLQLTLPARVVVPASHQAMVSAPVAGVIGALLVNVGDRVKAGQTLLELRSPQLAQLQRERSDAANQRQLARQQLERDAALEKDGIIATSRLQQSQTRARDADSLLGERDLAVKLAGGHAGLDGVARVVAPRAGVVAEVQVLPAQRVDQAAPLLRIADSGELSLELDASARQAAALPLGSVVTVAQSTASGVLSAKAPGLGAGQTVLLRARLTHPGDLVAGALVKAQVKLPAPPGTWSVPPNAVTRIDDRPVVFVAAPGGFRPVAVEQVSRLDDAVLVRGALHAGDRVAGSGVVAIKAAARSAP